MALLRWDFSGLQDRTTNAWGVLELTTEQAHWAESDLEEFGELRVVEILAGDPDWTRQDVTLESFLAGGAVHDVLNPQMIVDVPIAPARGAKTLITISPPVLQRLLAGRSLGIAIYEQGAISATFYSGAASPSAESPKLYIKLEESR